MRLIGVTGGIGSGKSVVCRICALRGLPVYDCDSRARQLMDESDAIKAELCRVSGTDVLTCEGGVDRSLLAGLIFSSEHMRMSVNAIVHEAVRHDLASWVSALRVNTALLESAVLHTSGLDMLVDEIWLVTAPRELRVGRVMRRSGLSRGQVEARISAQEHELSGLPRRKVRRIVNDGAVSLLAALPEYGEI